MAMQEKIALADRFAEIFRQEYRQVRDLLMDLIEALTSHDLTRARDLLGQVATLMRSSRLSASFGASCLM